MSVVWKGGITGGIGSGKSTACKIFELLGVPVYYADDAAKKLMQQNTTLRQQIQMHFGKDAYLTDGTLNRPFLSAAIFSNEQKRAILNNLVHPIVGEDVRQWFETLNHPYALEEAALLFESGSYQKLDFIITVTAPTEIRLKRVMNRDKVDRQAVIQRMNAQWTDDEKVKKSDFIIYNNETQALIPQILRIHRSILERCRKRLV